MPTRWDARIIVRAGAAAGLAFGLALLVTAATDEGGVAWAERLSRTLPLCPACAAIGVWAVLGPARARGETLALAALGRSKAQVAGAAAAGGAAPALVAALAMGISWVSVGAFFPRAGAADVWAWDGQSFVDRAHGLKVGSDGSPASVVRQAGVEPQVVPRHGRTAAALSIGLAGPAFALMMAHALLAPRFPSGRRRRGLGLGRGAGGVPLAAAGACVAASLVLFQAAAARIVPAMWGVAPAMGLLAFTAWRYRTAP
jgi:hypothetical protein